MTFHLDPEQQAFADLHNACYREMPWDFFPEFITILEEDGIEWRHWRGPLGGGICYPMHPGTDRAAGDNRLRETAWQALEMVRIRELFEASKKAST